MFQNICMITHNKEKDKKNKKMTSRFARPSFTFNNLSHIFLSQNHLLAIMDIDTLGWVFYSLTLKRVPARVLSGLLTADILSTLDLLDARSAIVPTAIDAS